MEVSVLSESIERHGHLDCLRVDVVQCEERVVARETHSSNFLHIIRELLTDLNLGVLWEPARYCVEAVVVNLVGWKVRVW